MGNVRKGKGRTIDGGADPHRASTEIHGNDIAVVSVPFRERNGLSPLTLISQRSLEDKSSLAQIATDISKILLEIQSLKHPCGCCEQSQVPRASQSKTCISSGWDVTDQTRT